MSTTVGNGLTVDGTVKASQATQAGEAVVLGDDGMIPANLVASGGGKVETPYFYVDRSTSTNCGRSSLEVDSSTTSVYEISHESKNTFGTDYHDGTREYPSLILPKYGAVANNLSHVFGTLSSKPDLYLHTLNAEYTTKILNDHIRTNLRGDFKIYTLRPKLASSTHLYGTTTGDEISITISDEGIIVNSGQIKFYNNVSKYGSVYLFVNDIKMSSLPEWC